MTADDFRRLALGLPETSERVHMGHPDFRAGGRVFATLRYPSEDWGMVKLSPEDQRSFLSDPAAFRPVKGAWGRHGCTSVLLKTARKPTLREALVAAWRNMAPKALVEPLECSAQKPAGEARLQRAS